MVFSFTLLNVFQKIAALTTAEAATTKASWTPPISALALVHAQIEEVPSTAQECSSSSVMVQFDPLLSSKVDPVPSLLRLVQG
jgi:hypothetical protein